MPNTNAAHPRSRGKIDQALADAVDLARDALAPIAHDADIGDHLGAVALEARLVAHYFACLRKGYRGWRWVATLARAPRARRVTVCEVALVPGDGSLLAPAWVPWAERLKPSDVGREDTLPYRAEDYRLEPADGDTGDDLDQRMIDEMGLGRARVLSEGGRAEAAARWYKSERGPARTSHARGSLPAQTCSTCGFMLKIAGSLRQAFGVCANEWSPDDGHVISLDHTCGAHSETDIEARREEWDPEPPRIDEAQIEVV